VTYTLRTKKATSKSSNVSETGQDLKLVNKNIQELQEKWTFLESLKEF
jgi:hypothetical protein